MPVPRRLTEQSGRYALVDGIPFLLPVKAENSPAFIAIFTVDPDKARNLLPGNEVHPFLLWNRALLVITVIDYRSTVIGKYIEFCIAIACTRGSKPSPRLLPAIFRNHYGFGQFVLDLPVSTEISVKGGKSIWGMPKRQANLDFIINDRTISSQYDLDGQLVMKIEIDRPEKTRLPIRLGTYSYSAFRGLLTRSSLYFKGKAGVKLFKKGSARIFIGDHPRIRPIKELEISPDPLAVAFIPASSGLLDDHFESWFLSYEQPPEFPMEGIESVVNLGLGQEWLVPPSAPVGQPEQAEIKGRL